MYNINMYHYRDRPYSQSRYYEIHPLNENGFEKYLSQDSHVHNYLSRLNPKVFKEIVGMDYETARTLSLKNPEQVEKNSHDACHEKVKPKKREENKSAELKEMRSNHEENNKEENYAEENVENPNMNQSNTDFQLRRTYPPKRGGDNKLTYGYTKPEKKTTHKYEKYLQEIDTLKKEKLNDNDFNITHSEMYYPQKRYDGFTAYRVPRIENYVQQRPKKSQTPSVKYQERLTRTVCCKGIPDENELIENRLQAANDQMKDAILNQTNKSYLKSTHLPEIKKIISSYPGKLIRVTGIGNGKYLGEKYNPYSFFFDNKNRTGRNYTGALYQH